MSNNCMVCWPDNFFLLVKLFSWNVATLWNNCQMLPHSLTLSISHISMGSSPSLETDCCGWLILEFGDLCFERQWHVMSRLFQTVPTPIGINWRVVYTLLTFASLKYWISVTEVRTNTQKISCLHPGLHVLSQTWWRNSVLEFLVSHHPWKS